MRKSFENVLIFSKFHFAKTFVFAKTNKFRESFSKNQRDNEN
jgi:hypothetical protein